MPTMLLFTGRRLRAVIDATHAKLVDQISRMLAKRRVPPQVRMKEYLDAQGSPHVRAAVEAFMKGHEWTFVKFRDFMVQVEALSRRLFGELCTTKATHVCFLVDSLHKSSFWVFLLALHLTEATEGGELMKRRKVALVVDDAGGMEHAFARLPPKDTVMVLMDDAVYSGEQLSRFLARAIDRWRAVHRGPLPFRPKVMVPFMSRSAVKLFRDADLMHAVLFTGLFYRRTVPASLSVDLFLERKGPLFSEYTSLLFDFLGVMPTNTLLLFEHKIADALSLPHRWLVTGPCVVPSTCKVAYRVKPDALPEVTAMMQAELKAAKAATHFTDAFELSSYALLKIPLHRDAARYVTRMMQSDRFRERFMERVPLEFPSKKPMPAMPAFVPLMPPEYCEQKYRRYLQRHIGDGFAFQPPDCRKPPYKRNSFYWRARP